MHFDVWNMLSLVYNGPIWVASVGAGMSCLGPLGKELMAMVRSSSAGHFSDEENLQLLLAQFGVAEVRPLLKRLLKSRGIKYTKEDTKEALAIDLYALVEEWIPVHEQGLEEKENEDGAPSTSEVTMAGEAGSANDETTEKRVADAPPAGAPSTNSRTSIRPE